MGLLYLYIYIYIYRVYIYTACHQGGPGLIPDRSVWRLWLIKWHWDKFSFAFFLSVFSHQCSTSLFILSYSVQKDKRAKRGNVETRQFSTEYRGRLDSNMPSLFWVLRGCVLPCRGGSVDKVVCWGMEDGDFLLATADPPGRHTAFYPMVFFLWRVKRMLTTSNQ